MTSSTKFQLILALLVWGYLFFLVAPMAVELTSDFLDRRSFAEEVETFHRACVEGRDMAINKRHTVGVSFDEIRWSVIKKGRDETLFSGTWRDSTKLGSNIPGGRFHFLDDGSCLVAPKLKCKEENMRDPQAEPHAVAIASDAPRIYTLHFDSAGEPKLEFDDF